MRINHNIASLRALNQMHASNSTLDKTLERLSSGLRINHAADDAAGLAISQKMDTQVRGLGQANRNAMDGISLIQTAEGAMNEVHGMLQRIRELAVQVSNGTYDSTDRKAVQSEVDQLLSEIQRISDDTEFNETKLLNGELDRRNFSTKENCATIESMSDTVDAGNYSFTVSKAASKTTLVSDGVATGTFDNTSKEISVGGVLNINGEQITIEEGDTNVEVFGKIRDLADKVNLSVVSSAVPFENESDLTFTHGQYGPKEINVAGSSALLDALGLIGGTKTMGRDAVVDSSTLTKANGFPSGTTVSALGQDIVFTANDNFELRASNKGGLGKVTLNILETGPLDLQIGANEGQFMEVRIPNLSPRPLGITGMNLSTAEGAQEAITLVDKAINMVSSVRSKLGAYQNRLEYTIANLSSAEENLTASMSRIQDADMAYEMSKFTQQNIISQAGNAMLAQANQRPQALLQLLQG